MNFLPDIISKFVTKKSELRRTENLPFASDADLEWRIGVNVAQALAERWNADHPEDEPQMWEDVHNGHVLGIVVHVLPNADPDLLHLTTRWSPA